MKQNVMRHGRCSLRDEAGRIKRPTAWAGRRGTVGRKVRAANAAAAGRAEGRARAGLGCHPFMSPRNEEKRLKPFRTWSPDEVPAARARRERDVSAEGGEEDETASVPSARFSSPASAAGSLKAAGAEAGPGSRLGEARGPRREPPLRPCRCAGQQRPPERPGWLVMLQGRRRHCVVTRPPHARARGLVASCRSAASPPPLDSNPPPIYLWSLVVVVVRVRPALTG